MCSLRKLIRRKYMGSTGLNKLKVPACRYTQVLANCRQKSAHTFHEITTQESTLAQNILHQRLDMVKFVMASNKTKFNFSKCGGTEKQCLSLENVLHWKWVSYISLIVCLWHFQLKITTESTPTECETEKKTRFCQSTPCPHTCQPQKNLNIHDSTWTRNLLLRRQTLSPLGHASHVVLQAFNASCKHASR